MKNKLLMILSISLLLVGCGNQSTTNETESKDTHKHSYVESVTKEATCTEAGEKSFSCECGDNYTEAIEATGHIYTNYVSNNDASYTADGTETATCVCGLTDTRTAEGSKLEYTFTEFAKTMYVKSTVNVRDLPNKDGEKIGSLDGSQEVSVTGQCAETGWYRINYNNGIAYVASDYLADEKPVVQTPAPSQPKSNWYDGYERYVWYDMGEYFFMIVNTCDEVYTYCNNFPSEYSDLLRERYPDRSLVQNGANIVTDTYSVALISAVYMDPEKGFPIWSIDYPWAH